MAKKNKWKHGKNITTREMQIKKPQSELPAHTIRWVTTKENREEKH